MKDTAFLVGSLLLIALVLVVPGHVMLWKLGGGALLGALWVYALLQATKGRLSPASPVRLLPGHALLFWALGSVKAEQALWAWIAVPALTVALDLARPPSLAAALHAILWAVLFALLHQVVALGRQLSGRAYVAWTAGITLVAVGYIAWGTWRRLKKGVKR